ncbi:MAG: MarR family winged helix-turn-helix transcriptional regulator [Lachnospiraceae bacterium]|nr:MarR family winged helix-turn-helix transcriptional regulator [Lachnospiraceae bacterium]MDD3797526.1 MarR family winged helix-turn-helix transcriptional regulator [Lachnospiraceae bacterium]
MDYRKEAEEAFEYMRKVNGFPIMRAMNDVSQGEMAVVGHLTFKQDGITAGELSAAFGLGSSRIAAILNTLTKKGLAKRASDPEDGRVVRVYVTDKGRREAMRRRDNTNAHLAGFLELLGEEDAKEFLRIIKKAAAMRER